MNPDGSFDSARYADQIHLAERELSSFISAVRELFGAEQALLCADDWLDESELTDSPPRSTTRDWRTVTVAASARLARRVTEAQQHRMTAGSSNTKLAIPSSNCLSFTLMLLSQPMISFLRRS
jgi:hypothetical protein